MGAEKIPVPPNAIAWVSATPLLLTAGHGSRGVATVANCSVHGIDRSCAEFVAADKSFSAAVTLLGLVVAILILVVRGMELRVSGFHLGRDLVEAQLRVFQVHRLGRHVLRLVTLVVSLHGGVIDWVHLWFYGPTFNLADVWLRGGVLLAAAGWLWRSRAAAGTAREGRRSDEQGTVRGS